MRNDLPTSSVIYYAERSLKFADCAPRKAVHIGVVLPYLLSAGADWIVASRTIAEAL